MSGSMWSRFWGGGRGGGVGVGAGGVSPYAGSYGPQQEGASPWVTQDQQFMEAPGGAMGPFPPQQEKELGLPGGQNDAGSWGNSLSTGLNGAAGFMRQMQAAQQAPALAAPAAPAPQRMMGPDAAPPPPEPLISGNPYLQTTPQALRARMLQRGLLDG